MSDPLSLDTEFADVAAGRQRLAEAAEDEHPATDGAAWGPIRHRQRLLSNRVKERLMQIVFAGCATAAIGFVALICVFLFANGLPAIFEIGPGNFLGGTTWAPSSNLYGIAPMIIASVYVTLGAIIVGVPLGLLCAVFLARFASRRSAAALTPAVSLMAGIPSIVFGYFGLLVLAPLLRDLTGSGKSILTAALLLGIMILPTVISISTSALRAVPDSYYEGALALGASHERAVFTVVLPAAKSGVFTAVILGIGRAIGETMAVIMVAGNQAWIPTALTDGARTLTANIVLEMGYATDLHRDALIATGVVLFVFILLINLVLSIVKNRRAA